MGGCYTSRMQADAGIDRVLIGREAISRRLDELAQAITADLCAQANDIPDQITLVPILTGSIVFLSDLIRRLPLRMQIRVISVSSYPGTSQASQGAKIEASLSQIPETLVAQHVLIIDDILDSGQTLRLATDLLQAKQPATLRTCVLLRKKRPIAMAFPVDYVAFEIPDEFVVGYGLDFDDYYRNLPDIVTLRSDFVSQAVRQAGKQFRAD